ncbi:hypothetical protein XELAEV_18006996mg [Xenopus laevis]|uniref:Uncharacterized protein n=1 Tax=Xenopus laevis TaxID=8355 RepID=A0A974I419_XENLA|nr:hypothetical protein XELAEV_18006996mg [Xenopus laevis]
MKVASPVAPKTINTGSLHVIDKESTIQLCLPFPFFRITRYFQTHWGRFFKIRVCGKKMQTRKKNADKLVQLFSGMLAY